MMNSPYSTALIVGVGPGISASLARRLTGLGVRLGLASRNIVKLHRLAKETTAKTFAADVAEIDSVAKLFKDMDATIGVPDLVVFNAQARVHGPLAELDPSSVASAISVGAFGGFLVAQQAARRMIPRGHGAILLTGATASTKGFAHSAPFAMSKFALRALAQSAARELGPKGIHVAHFVVDGVVRSERNVDPVGKPDSTIDPDAIAKTYIDVLRQPRSGWSLEVEIRPWVENF